MIHHSDSSGIRLRPEGIEIQGLCMPLRSAGFPYWELAPACWERALDSVLELRLRILRVDVPWVLHEYAPDSYDWGERRPELDLGRLLGLAHARGLFVLIRPGPWLGRSFPEGGGLPVRVLALSEVRALDASGVRWPVPGVASERLLSESQTWLDALSAYLMPYLYPDGPVVAGISGSLGPVPPPWGGGALDRSKDALSFYSRFLKVKYPGSRAPIGFPPLSGPSRVEDLERGMAWVEAGELAQRRHITRSAPATSSTDQGKAGPAPVHIGAVLDPGVCGGGDAWAASGAMDGVTLVFPEHSATDFAALRLLGLRAAEIAPSAGVLELPAGGSLLSPRPAFDPPSAAAVLAMSGTRALDIDTLVPRERLAEVSAPLDARDGTRTRVGSRWRALFRLLDAIEHPACRRRSDCLLLANRELARVREACASTGELPPELGSARARDALRIRSRDLGLRARPERDPDGVFHALFDGRRSSGVAFSVADTSLPVERLADWRVVLLVGFEHISRPLAQRIFGWVAEGGTLVVGPRLPTRDWAGAPLHLNLPQIVKEPLERVRVGQLALEAVDLLSGAEPVLEHEVGMLAATFPFQAGRIVHFGFRFPWRSSELDSPTLTEIIRALLAPAGVEPCYPVSDPRVETELFRSGDRSFLFLANPGPDLRSVKLRADPNEALREIRGGGRHVRAGEPLALAGRSVVLREVVRL